MGNGSIQKSVKSTLLGLCDIRGCDMTALDDPRRGHPMQRIRMAHDVSSLALYHLRQDMHVITKYPRQRDLLRSLIFIWRVDSSDDSFVHRL
ncbi:hypothetical protein Tco_0833855 [Tanacetum coccineum]